MFLLYCSMKKRYTALFKLVLVGLFVNTNEIAMNE